MNRRKASDMKLMTIEQQDELIQRRQGRKDIREANKRLATAVLAWLIDGPLTKEERESFMEAFNANGHFGHYHEYPTDTTMHRVTTQAKELDSIVKHLNDTPLDYMGAIELGYVYQRILGMIVTIERHPDGRTRQDALDLYKIAGDAIRQKVYNEMGHWPEEFPIPSGRITGKEADRLFRAANHQPSIFDVED